MKAQIDYQEYADQNQQRQIQNQLYKNNLNHDYMNLPESTEYFSADNFGNLDQQAFQQFLRHLYSRHPDQTFKQLIDKYFQNKRKCYEMKKNQNQENQKDDIITFLKQQLQKINQQLFEKYRQFQKLREQNTIYAQQIITHEQIIKYKFASVLPFNQENLNLPKLQKQSQQTHNKLQNQYKKLDLFKEKHKNIGKKYDEHFDHQYRQINTSFSGINQRKKQLLREKDFNRKYSINYNTFKNQNFKRQLLVREKEQIIKIQQIKMKNQQQDLQKMRLSQVIDYQNERKRKKLSSIKNQKKQAYVSIEYQKPSRIINLLLILWLIILVYFTINIFI